MRGFNKVMLYGNLTADPESINAKEGKPFTVFNIAVNRDWKNKKGDVVHDTDFHHVVAFGKLAEVTSTYLHKGQPVIVSGRLNNRSYLNKEGEKRYTTEVVMDDFNFVSRGKKVDANGVILEENEAIGSTANV